MTLVKRLIALFRKDDQPAMAGASPLEPRTELVEWLDIDDTSPMQVPGWYVFWNGWCFGPFSMAEADAHATQLRSGVPSR